MIPKHISLRQRYGGWVIVIEDYMINEWCLTKNGRIIDSYEFYLWNFINKRINKLTHYKTKREAIATLKKYWEVKGNEKKKWYSQYEFVGFKVKPKVYSYRMDLLGRFIKWVRNLI